MSTTNYKDVATALTIGSVIVAPIAVTLPDPLSKAILALSIGLANAAIIAAKHNGNGGSAQSQA